MKILCLCRGGNCRSVNLAYLLKYHYGHDALAAGIERNSRDTLMMLFAWAEKIVVLETALKEYVPLQHLKKTAIYDVGADKWFKPPQDLLQSLEACIRQDKTLVPTGTL